MKISVITVCYNSESTIERAVQSVISQKDVDLEYIVIDGGSNDGTKTILESFKNDIDILVSEPDKGIYDAMNKGVEKASGDIIAILNSDDFYVSDTSLKKVIDSFTLREVQAVYGDILYVDPRNPERIVRTWKAGKYSYADLKDGWIPPHPAFFVKKGVYSKFGAFRTDFSIAADYEFMLRVIGKYGITMNYIEDPLVYMQSGGHSATSLKQRIKGWKELTRAWRVNDMIPPNALWLRRILSKLHQYFV